LRIGEWFEEMQKQGVYDNTRIIIVSDHGSGIDAGLSDDKFTDIIGSRVESYNPVLMIKDFNTHGALKTDNNFMTNADVPCLAVKDIVDNPTNPFTGKPLETDKKLGVYATTNHLFFAWEHGKYVFKIKPAQWFSVHDNIMQSKNWTKVNN
jgi:arylsulfatase A-like enzyme